MSGYLPTILGAIIPIFALIGLGYALRQSDFPGESFWPQVERLTYFLLFPALLIEKLATADIEGGRILPITGAAALTLLVMTALLLALRRALPVNGAGFTSVFQGAVRFNTYLGVATAFAVFGPQGAAVAALTMAVLIPFGNVLCVTVLMVYAGRTVSLGPTLRGIVKNPLIVACVVGIGLNRSGLGLPLGSHGIFEIVGRAALPLGLMTVGAGLQLRTAWGRATAIGTSTVLKLAVMPLVAWASAKALGLATLETQILVLFAALPTATSAYILARQLGGDHTLVATILTVETLIAAVSLPLTLLLLV